MSEALAAWLDGVGLGGCYASLAAHAVDLDVLPDLIEHDLEKIGLPLGERKRLLRAIGAMAARLDPGNADRPAAARAERRRLTVMFCDLAGSTEIAARLDPEDFHEVVNAHLAVVAAAITRFGGFVARYQGDGLLAYFGWPQASDNDAQRAASAALAVLADVDACTAPERMPVRVGIATGLVVVGDIIGEGTAREVVVSGETPNLAARLQSATPPGSALLAGETRALLGEAFELGEQRRLALRGFARPIDAWPLLRERHAAQVAPIPSRRAARVLARDAEFEWMDGHWRAARAGEARVLLLSGEPGIGKSCIAEHFAGALTGPHHRLHVRALQRHASSPLYPVVGLLRALAGLDADDTIEARGAKLATLLDRVERPFEADGQAPETQFALLAALLDLPVPDPATLDPDPRQRKAVLMATLAEVVASHARTRPILLLVEDVHWADPTTVELLGAIARRLAAMPALMLLLTRPGFHPAWEDVSVDARSIGPLSREAGGALVGQVAGKRLPPEVADEILRRGDGVPLFIEEVTRAVLESGCLEEAEDCWRLTGPIAQLEIPATLHDSLVARLDRLGWTKELCQIGAVIGREFSSDLLAALTRHEAHRLETGLRQLVLSGLVSEGVGPRGPYYSFRHALVHDAAYRSLLHSARRNLHGQVAGVIGARFPQYARQQPEVLAHHYAEAQAHDEAADWWQRAGERDARRSANQEALAHFTRTLEALQRCPPSPGRDLRELDIRRRLGTAQIAIEGYTSEAFKANAEQMRVVTDRIDDPSGLFVPLGAQFAGVYSRGEMAEALPLAQQIMRVADRTRQRGQRMIAHRLLGMALVGAGDPVGAERELLASLSLAKPDEDARRMPHELCERSVAALGYLSLAEHVLARPEQALTTDARALARARVLDHPGTTVYALTLRACLLVLRGDDAALAKTAGALAEAARRQGSRPGLIAAETLGALVQAARHPGEALFATIRAGIEELRAIGWSVLVAWTTFKEIEVNLALGHDELARAALDGLWLMLTARGYDFFRAPLLYQRAELARRAGQEADRARLLADAGTVARVQGAALWGAGRGGGATHDAAPLALSGTVRYRND